LIHIQPCSGNRQKYEELNLNTILANEIILKLGPTFSRISTDCLTGYIKASPTFRRHISRFVGFCLSHDIAGTEAEETLHEHKTEVQKRAKCQAGTRRVICRGGALQAGDAADRIQLRRKKEVETARRRSLFGNRRGNVRKSFKRKLDFMAASDDLNRSAPRADRAVSI
jgi:hypothetical protein